LRKSRTSPRGRRRARAGAGIAPERLALLVPWLNGELRSVAAVHGRLTSFLESFDGTADAGYVRLYSGEEEPWRPAWIDTDRTLLHRQPPVIDEPGWTQEDAAECELDALRMSLLDLLRRGFPLEVGQEQPVGTWLTDLPSLRFGIRSAERPVAKLTAVKAKVRAAYLAPGAYTLVVDGALRDLVPFLVAHLLTAPRMVALMRCPAPAPRNWSERCGRFFIRARRRGRPPDYCSTACRVRNYEHEKKQSSAKRRSTR
jgi:hypothetical protein